MSTIFFITISFCFKDVQYSAINLLGCINVNDHTREELRLLTDLDVNC